MGWSRYGLELAARVSEAVFIRFRFPRVGKMCLVACNAAEGNVSIADLFCKGLLKGCQPPERRPLMVAAWDNYVSVAEPENTGLKDRRWHKPKDAGHKVSMDEDDKRVWAKSLAAKHKLVWVL